ncbi:hypothetical protein J416_00704 [Gracilibacillus halophilus YIM-C55.5]|uniref:Uncharacterized protein n=1 Tax=Gracilibacillus halophilus YIM-C55.5 TaxID=1308866 RepID=N4WV32_9BACI|nr:MinD/ParA family protein [Gracilibacillus halophilus]ENH98220.1 hypothetical protein J416_00704 [Gracilibacillus halophilus YIM-C55.5]
MGDQAANLRQKMKKLQGYQQAKTLAVVSGKGGVGKSNIALNFSLSLAKKGKKVLLFDLDVGMGNIDVLLGVTQNQSIVTMLEKNLSIYGIIESGPYSLSYISGGTGQNQIFYLNQDRLDFFLDQLQEVFYDYDYIIFDMGAGVTRDSIHFILAVDECVLVTTPEPTSLTDAYAMVKHILLQQPLPFYLLLNRVQSRKQAQEMESRMEQAVKQFLNYDIQSLGWIPDDQAVMEAVIHQEPFIIHNPKAPVSKAMNRMVNHYIGDQPKKEQQSGFLAKLRHFMKER